jgi:DNA repair protein RadC
MQSYKAKNGAQQFKPAQDWLMAAVVNEKTGQYMTDSEIVELALAVLQHKFGQRTESMLNSPSAVRQYLMLRMAQLEHEVFVVIFLDSQNRAIATEELFRGTLTQTSVYPREVVKRALHHNAGGVIFAHNHPSGIAEPSHADERITATLKDALAILDVKVLDHFIVAGATTISFAERGLI